MPKSTLSPPANRLRVGGCIADVLLREITRADGSITRVTVKSMAVLLLLAERAGQVVGRDALLETVWAGTMPTDDVVTQAVALLRKALGDDRDAPVYVETIPKSGYRLLAAVEWLPQTDDPSAQHVGPQQATSHEAWWQRWRLTVIALAVALAFVLAWVVADRRNVRAPAAVAPAQPAPASVDVAHTLLTSRPGPETQPALSPDGALLAYAMPPGVADDAPAIFLQAAQPTPPRQLTTPPPGASDHLPRWSPDGRQLLFARIDEQQGCELQLMSASGGATRMVGRCERINGRYDWLPDGSGVIAGLEPAGEGRTAPLSILRFSDGQWRPLRYRIAAGDVDFDPHYSPDGRQLAFRRGLSNSDLWTMPAAGGAPRRLTRLRGSISGWDWSADSRALLLGFVGNPPQLYRHELASGRTEALGRFPASGLDVAGDALVFAVDQMRTALYRYPLPMREGGAAEALFASTGNDSLPSPSPDGRWLAFHSDRSREARLWLGEIGRPDQLRMIEGFAPVSRHPPQWSEDGDRLLAIGEATDEAGTTQPRLYEIDAASGRTRMIAVEAAPYFAQYLPQGRMLRVVDRGAGKLSLQVVAGGRELARLDDVGEARFDPASGQILYVRSDRPGLWRTGLDLRAPVLLAAAQPVAYWRRRWAVLAGRPFQLRTAAPVCMSMWQWLDHAPGPGPGCLDRGRRGAPTLALVVSRDGHWLYASMLAGQENSDIGLLRLSPMGLPTH